MEKEKNKTKGNYFNKKNVNHKISKNNERIMRKKNMEKIKLNTKIYPLEVIYSAAYILIDKAYIKLGGDPKKEVEVELTPKEGRGTYKEIEGAFLDELINYADYNVRSEKTRAIREMIMQRAIITNDPAALLKEKKKQEDEEFEKLLKELEDEDGELEDPEGIAVPWEEKYGKDKNKTG
jgi:His-Xaa-Ser system protein HxsD